MVDLPLKVRGDPKEPGQEEQKVIEPETKKAPSPRDRQFDPNRDAPLDYQFGVCKDLL
eukprot:gnl/Chilomastix_caulleri/6608.p2 GENE.gnl/Chilomastix_caulleri/6608~~gnl/Chilomastix_caulleri/6608.p2  ORF type:complete len:58 (+),score=7.58 gnl/Chilomastix_caulleri/6608:89-262(+)